MATNNLNQVWPEWHIEKQLGKGTYGTVYKVVRRDDNFTSYAAVKIISIPQDPAEIDTLRSEGLDMAQSKTYLKGVVNDFVNEIKIMQSFKGTQNIVSIEDYKVVPKTDGIGWDIYIRMELLTSFNEYTCDKKLTEPDVIKLGIDICSALELCESRNIIHRDIKPENIFINDFGYFKLGDFGIARTMANMTNGMSQKGTPFYMAPEVFTGNRYDARVDIYSLGLVLYRLLNGNRIPFLDTEKQLLNPNERRNALDRRIRGEVFHAPCEASPAMSEIILRACAHNPDLRFASAFETKQALMSVANSTYRTPSKELKSVSTVQREPEKKTGKTAKPHERTDKTVSVRKAPNTDNMGFEPKAEKFGDVISTKDSKASALSKLLNVFSHSSKKVEAKKVKTVKPGKCVDRPQDLLSKLNINIDSAYGCIRNGCLGDAKALLQKELEAFQNISKETYINLSNQAADKNEFWKEYSLKIAKICIALGVLCKETGESARADEYYAIEKNICKKYAIEYQTQKYGGVAENYFEKTRKSIGISSAWGTNEYIEHLLVEETNIYRLLCLHDSLRYYRELCAHLWRYGILLDQTSRVNECIKIFYELLYYYETTQHNSNEIISIRNRIKRLSKHLSAMELNDLTYTHRGSR